MNRAAFTVDVEDGISISMRDSYGIEMLPTERVLINTKVILELLNRHGIKATFFVLGIVAKHYPELIKEIANNGHELGIHGYSHYEFSKMDEQKAFQELDTAKKLVEDISGVVVNGHRAPAFSINPETRWGLDVIESAGFTYDSSIMPMRYGRYGWPLYNPSISRIKTPKGKDLIEVPLTVSGYLGFQIPACGGRFFQLLPYYVSDMAMKRVLHERPAVFYMHPYEIDTARYPEFYYQQLKKTNLLKKIKTYAKWLNRGSFYKKMEKLVTKYEFDTVENIIEDVLGNKALME